MKTHGIPRGFAARPVSLFVLLLAAMALVNALIAGCGSKSSQSEGTSSAAGSPSGAATPAAAPAASPATAPDGAQIYATRCTVCHGASGKGDGPGGAALNPKPRDHTNGAYMNARTDDQLLEVIRNGKGAMPAWKSVLTDEEVHAALKHVRSLAVPPYKG